MRKKTIPWLRRCEGMRSLPQLADLHVPVLLLVDKLRVHEPRRLPQLKAGARRELRLMARKNLTLYGMAHMVLIWGQCARKNLTLYGMAHMVLIWGQWARKNLTLYGMAHMVLICGQ